MRAASTGGGDGAIVIEGFSRLDFGGACYVRDKKAPHVVIDTTHGAIVGPRIPGLYTHGTHGGVPASSLVIRGVKQNGIVSLDITATRLAASEYAVDNPAPLKLTNLRLRHHEVTPDRWDPGTRLETRARP